MQMHDIKISSVDGNFVVKNSKEVTSMSLGAIMMYLNIELTNTLDEQIATKVSIIQGRNEQMRFLSEITDYCRRLKASVEDEQPDVTAEKEFSFTFTVDGESKTITLPLQNNETDKKDSWVEYMGWDWKNVENVKENKMDDEKKIQKLNSEWDVNISMLTGKMDVLNADSQMDNIELQDLLDKRSNAFQMASQVLDSDSQNMSEIIRNL